MLVEVAGEVLVLGSSGRDLTLLTRVTEEARVAKLLEHSAQTIGPFAMFQAGRWEARFRKRLSSKRKMIQSTSIIRLHKRSRQPSMKSPKLIRQKHVWWKSNYVVFVCCLIGLWLSVSNTYAQGTQDPLLTFQLSGGEGTEPWTIGIKILVLLTVLSLAPALLTLLTSFTRLVIVLGLLRQAMGTMHAPPNQVVIGMALFMTLFIMMPVWEEIRVEAINPYLEQRVEQDVAMERAITPVREFMFRQVREKDLTLFVEMAGLKDLKNSEDVPLHVLIPALSRANFERHFRSDSSYMCHFSSSI